MKSYFILFSLLITVLQSCSSDKDPVPYVNTPNCSDGIKNGTETSIDCGGVCGGCEDVPLPTQGHTAATSYPGYELKWSDEFEGKELDHQKWGYHVGTGCPDLCGWGNSELQYFTNSKSNTFVNNGNLFIKATNTGFEGTNYSSGRIHTDNKFEFKYGRVDIRASMPSAAGTWVALFLLNKNYSLSNPGAYWPSGGEIDVMEYIGENHNNILGTAHYGTDSPNNHRYNSANQGPLNNQTFNKAYYVYSIIWEENKISWLINDIEYHSITPATTLAQGQPYPFNDEFYFIFALSVGGRLTTIAPNPTNFPDYLIVDYVRVYQKN